MPEMKSLQAVAIVLVVIGLVIGIGFLVLTEFEETLGTDTATVNNETLTSVGNTSCSYVANNHTTADLWCYNTFAVVTITNATGGEIIASGNYTTQTATGCIQATTGAYVDEDWNVSYTYQFGNGSSACEGVGETINATEEIPTWLSVVVILLIVGVLMYLVFKFVPKLSSGGVTGAEGTIAQV